MGVVFSQRPNLSQTSGQPDWSIQRRQDKPWKGVYGTERKQESIFMGKQLRNRLSPSYHLLRCHACRRSDSLWEYHSVVDMLVFLQLPKSVSFPVTDSTSWREKTKKLSCLMSQWRIPFARKKRQSHRRVRCNFRLVLLIGFWAIPDSPSTTCTV